MKPLITLALISLLLAFSTKMTMQKQLAEGTLQYRISISSAKSEAPITNSLNGATLFIYLKPTISRTDMKSALGTESAVYDAKAKDGFILKEYSGQKLMITLQQTNWDDKNKLYENLNFTIGNETINIAGYPCKKATATLPGNKTFTVYFNPEIQVFNKTYNTAFHKLPGLPVQYELQSGNLTFKYTLNQVSYDAVPQSKFESPKTGYRVMTYEENQQLKNSGK